MPDINKASLDKFQVYRQVTVSGQIGLDRYIVKAEASLRVTLDNAVGSTVDIYGAIGDGPFDLIGSIAGNGTDVFDISSVDYIYFTCSTFFSTFDLFAAGFYPVSPESMIVPAGAATEAKQDIGNTSLTNIDANTQPSTNPTIYNVTMTLAGTEYSQALSANTKKVLARVRGGGELRIAFLSGDTSVKWITISRGAVYSEDGLDLVGVTLYMQCDVPGRVAEILEWT